MKLNWSQVLAWRVRQHHLDAPVPRTRMLDVASRVAGMQVAIEPFETLPKSVVKAAEAEATRLAEFLGGTLELDWVTSST